MKTKGITIWEKHAEKMVLGLAVAAAGFLIARQFIGQPNAVQVAGGRTVAPGEIDALLEQEAERYQGKLDDRSAPGLELPEPRLAFESLDRGLGGAISPNQTLALAGSWVGPSADVIGPQQAVEFAVPAIKAPRELLVSQFADALTEAALEETPELKERFPDPAQPADLKYVTVFAHFDVADLRAQFKAAGEGLGMIPVNWYLDRPETIVDVVVRRQELVGEAWTNETVLEQIPGRASFRPRISGEVSGVTREAILKELTDPAVQTQVVQPEFYETRNDAWELPSLAARETEPDVDEGPGDPESERLNRDLASKRSQREREAKKLKDDYGIEYGGKSDEPPEDEEDKQDDPAKRKDKPGEGRAPPGQGGGGFGVGGAGGKRNAVDTKAQEKIRKAIDGIKGRIARLDKDIEAIERKLKDLGAAVAAPEQQTAEGGFDLAKDSEVWVWAHDIGVLPEHTYRYAMTVRVYNPLFGRKRSLVEKQQPLADAFALDSPQSEWSAPTTVKPFFSYFVTDAYPPGGSSGPLGLGRATIEVHRFSDGQWWMETFSVQPGDSIGGSRPVKVGDVQREIDFSTGLVLVDVIEGIEGSGTGPNAGKTSRVLLQDLDSPDVLVMRDPAVDSVHHERQDLRSREAERVASSGP